MISVGDIMTHGAVTLALESSAEDACEKLLAHRIGGAPVVDGAHVVGVVSKTDLLLKDKTAKISEVMTAHVQFVCPTDPAQVAIDLMLSGRIHRLVVLAAEGGVVGMVTTTDVLRAIQRGDALHIPPNWPDDVASTMALDEGGF